MHVFDNDLAVFIGRFQPFHDGHLRVVREALLRADRLLVVIGSEGAARRPDLIPFTADERREMILASLTPEERGRVILRATPDVLNLPAWAAQVRELAAGVACELGLADPRVALIGCSKDRSSYYLRAFPGWASISVPHHEGLSATPLRAAYFDADPTVVDAFLAGEARTLVPPPVVAWLQAFRAGPAYPDLVEELAFARAYRQAWAAAPYPPTFVTADAVVVHGDRVLLIRRKGRPGRGLWALPGGFVEQDEFVADAAIRELGEETGLAVPADDLRRAMGPVRVFDAPLRDMRGRMITHAALFRLDGVASEPPAVSGRDDAAEARWVPLAELRRDELFADHYVIIQTMLAPAGEGRP